MAEILHAPVALSDAASRAPHVREIAPSDLRDALVDGWRDFLAAPTQLFFLAAIYPVIGVALALAASGRDLIGLLWPLATGFALLGPVAALGIYEISRRRETGVGVSWRDGLGVLRSPSIGSILGLALVLLALFVAWLVTAQWLYGATLGPARPSSPGALLAAVLGTREGLVLLVAGNAAGLLFAAAALVLTVVSFPLLLERDVGPLQAVRTSIRAVATSPGTMALWGVVVAGLLFLGSLPLFVGLAVVIPVLGHATWHLYRRVVV